MQGILGKTLVAAVLAAGIAVSGAAGAANLWGLYGEEKARFDAKVVDILCELTGDCPDNCGDGKRQLGLLRPDGTLVLAVKNQDIFAGAVVDLLPHCGQTITADGLMIENDYMTMFALQFVKPGEAKWRKADKLGDDFKAANPDKNRRQWFRHHPVATAHLKKYGVLGLPGVEPPPQ